MENVMTIAFWWLTAAFILGLIARIFRLPALIGFLVAGMLVEALKIDHSNMDELIDFMKYLQKNPAETQKIGKAGQKTARELFNTQNFIQQWDRFLSQVVPS